VVKKSALEPLLLDLNTNRHDIRPNHTNTALQNRCQKRYNLDNYVIKLFTSYKSGNNV